MKLISLGLAYESRNILNNPAVPLSSPLAWNILTGGSESDAAELVNPVTSMGQASVNACVRLISSSIASMNPILYEQAGSGKIEAINNPLHRILSLEPNPDQCAFSLWDSFVASIALWGNGYLEIQRDGVDNVVGLWFLQPTMVTPIRNPDGSLQYRITQGMKAGEYRLLPAKSVIHVPWRSVDGVTGISVIAEARAAVGGAIAMDKFGNRYFANNATPSGVLSTTAKVKPEDRIKMRQDWEALHSAGNQHRTAILDNDLKYQSISIPNSDSQWIDAMKMSRESICGLFGLQCSQIGSEARVAGETYAAQQMAFLTDCLRPWLNRITQELTRKLLPGLPQYSIAHDVSDRLRLDFKSQMDGFAVARQWGLMTANQCRKSLDLDPGPAECDAYWMPVNMIDAKGLLDTNKPVVEGNENG